MVLNTNTKRESGKKVQIGNIQAAKAVADTIQTTLGPRAMLKMILDAMGGIVMTNDGNAILREIDVSHPAAKSMIELSRTQDEEVGDGTTSVIIMAGEVLHLCMPFLERQVHPTVIIQALQNALNDAVELAKAAATNIDVDTPEGQVLLAKLVESSVGTKFTNRFNTLMVELAMQAVKCVAVEDASGRLEIDVKRYAKVEKIPGGEMDDCRVLKGVMFNKDVSHAKMRRKIENPRVILLDCPLEYKKSESGANVECTDESDWAALLRQEEDWIKKTVATIMKLKPDLVITEKGLSDLAQHYFVKGGVTALRRLRKSDKCVKCITLEPGGVTIFNSIALIHSARTATGSPGRAVPRSPTVSTTWMSPSSGPRPGCSRSRSSETTTSPSWWTAKTRKRAPSCCAAARRMC